jgi:hypothetical protein
MSRSASDDGHALEARLQNLPRIQKVVHDDDNSKTRTDPDVRSYKPSRESIAMMHGELDGSIAITNDGAQENTSSSHPGHNRVRETKNAPGGGDSSCCLIL